VGVGFLGGQDGECEPCLRGDFANCLNPVISGITTDGGYAEVMIAEARALASIPDELTSAKAAPRLCAGITTFNALRNAGLRAGDLVGIQGIGGLGHLGVQFARRMGWGSDAAICATGTTIKKAGSKEAFRSVDHDLPLSFARMAHQAGTQNFALVSAIEHRSIRPSFTQG